MRYILHLSLFISVVLTACGQNYNNPGSLEFSSFEIGDTVDTSLFKKYKELYFPNYLDGWTMQNVSQLPSKYEGLPIAIWTLKSDSSVALTLLDNRVLNITKSYLTTDEKEVISNSMIEKFGGEPKKKTYEESHPLQSWITYWELETWKTEDVIVQIGHSDMRKPNHPKPKEIRWNLVYSNFNLENEIIKDYKKKLKMVTLYIANRTFGGFRKFNTIYKHHQIVDFAFKMNKIKKYNILAQCKLESSSLSNALLAIY